MSLGMLLYSNHGNDSVSHAAIDLQTNNDDRVCAIIET